ncbi:peptidoglycan-binding protein [Streptomyces sp. NPDC058955]|uniref:peptidoglycan-binding domain-containing protein n=1 Tax=unclassified Streptomyces TaxID=2593676 RepID=UPI00364946C8
MNLDGVDSTVKRTLSAVGAAAAVIVGTIAAAPAASAADGYCGSSVSAERNGYWTFVPATSGGSTSCVMSRGASSEAVTELQQALTICHGLDTGGIDGVYGAKTEAAVRTVQSQHGLSADGIYGPNTRNVVSWRWYANIGATCARL